MIQSDIFYHVYSQFSKKLEDLTKDKELSNIIRTIKTTDATYDLSVSDISQCEFDRNGDQVIFEEKMYPAPTNFQMAFGVEVFGKKLESVLKLYGMIARYLKDNPKLELGEYVWHMFNSKEIYIEPLIRAAEGSRVSKGSDGNYSFKLQYAVSIGLNSTNAVGFVRAKERVISSNVK